RAQLAVRGHSRRDQRVRDLEEERPPAAQQEDGLAVDAPGDTARAEQAARRIDRLPAACRAEPSEVTGGEERGVHARILPGADGPVTSLSPAEHPFTSACDLDQLELDELLGPTGDVTADQRLRGSGI